MIDGHVSILVSHASELPWAADIVGCRLRWWILRRCVQPCTQPSGGHGVNSSEWERRTRACVQASMRCTLWAAAWTSYYEEVGLSWLLKAAQNLTVTCGVMWITTWPCCDGGRSMSQLIHVARHLLASTSVYRPCPCSQNGCSAQLAGSSASIVRAFCRIMPTVSCFWIRT